MGEPVDIPDEAVAEMAQRRDDTDSSEWPGACG
jgi:hypothetical protein